MQPLRAEPPRLSPEPEAYPAPPAFIAIAYYEMKSQSAPGRWYQSPETCGTLTV